MRRALAALLAVALAVSPVGPALADRDAAEIKAELDALGQRYGELQAELRELIAKIQAIAPETPMKARQEHANRLLQLRGSLDSLRDALEAKRRELAVLGDWYVLTVEGSGVSTARSSLGGFLLPEVIRSRGFQDFAVRVDRGQDPRRLVAETRRLLGTPQCLGGPGRQAVVSVSGAPQFWEQLNVLISAGPFDSRTAAEARRRQGTLSVAEVIPMPDPNQLLRTFGCPEQALQALRVPDVRGLPRAEAQARLQQHGLVVELSGGDPAPTRGQEDTVQSHKPSAGASVPPRSKVVLVIHGPVVPKMRVPAVIGLGFAEARQRLERAGLAVVRRDLGPAPSREQQHTVRGQEPGANAEVEAGATVTLDTLAAYVPSPQEQVTQTRCAPNSEAFWDAGAGRPACRCVRGFVWDGQSCVMDREGAVAGLRCPPNARAYWDDRANQAQCQCLQGFAWNGSACVMDRNAAVANLRCPPNAQPYWDERANQPRCRCVQGFVQSGNACVLDRNAAVANLRCPPNARGYWNDRANQAQCQCVQGFVWNGSACVLDRHTAVANLRCPANANAYWDDRAGRAQCRCNAGYTASGRACVRASSPPPPPSRSPCPPGYEWSELSVLGQGDGACYPKRR